MRAQQTLPPRVVFFNQWTNFQDRELQSLFHSLSDEEIENLGVGDTVWMDDEPHPNGKVYGFSQVQVTRLDRDGEAIKIHYEGQTVRGMTTVSGQHKCRSVFRCRDGEKLITIVANEPLATRVHTY